MIKLPSWHSTKHLSPSSTPQLHSHLIVTGLTGTHSLFHSRNYTIPASFSPAHNLFDEMPQRDADSRNCLVSYLKHGLPPKTFNTVKPILRNPHSRPNPSAFAEAMKACASLRCRRMALQLHGLVSKFDFATCPKIVASLVNMHIACGCDELAARVFETSANANLFAWNSMILCYSRLHGVENGLDTFRRMRVRNTVSWNTAISLLSRHGRADETMSIAVEMFAEGYALNSTTYSSVLSAAASVRDLDWGRHLHANIMKSQSTIDAFVGSALVDMYAKCGWLKSAMRVFDSLADGSSNVVSWTALIGGFSQSGLVEEALKLFRDMRLVPVVFDRFTLATVISASYSVSDGSLGSQLHCLSVKSGHVSSVPVSNALLAMYSKCGNIESAECMFCSMRSRDVISWTSMIATYSHLGNVGKAREFFDTATTRNVITWNTMIAAYTQRGHEEEGLKMYISMLREDKVRPDWVTFTTLISACADTGAFVLGTQVIAHATKTGLNTDTSVSNAVITMHSKCGRIGEARAVFDSIREKDLVSWNATIAAYARHGQGKEAIEMFETMVHNGIVPDYISYVAVLSGCSRSGLVHEGKHYFRLLTKAHNVSPGAEHYACMVDLLGRAGLLTEAKEMIDAMPIEPSAGIWGALLGACKIHGNTKLAEIASKHIFDMGLKDPGNYVLLAKMYTDKGNLDGCAEVRRLMREKGIRKDPGCSWIEVKNTVHVFTADDPNHPRVDFVLRYLDEMTKKIERLGYVKKVSSNSRYRGVHSEKLAVAFGLVSLPSCAPVYVMKNLRICDDCHDVLKLVSLAESRDLVVRDAVRFHHFGEGHCSCGDYW